MTIRIMTIEIDWKCWNWLV